MRRAAAAGIGVLAPWGGVERRALRFGLLAALLAAAIAVALTGLRPAETTSPPVAPVAATPLVPGPALPAPTALPLLFAEIEGAVVARGAGYRFAFEPRRVLLSLAGAEGALTLALDLVGGNPGAAPRAVGPSGATVSDLRSGGTTTAPGHTQVVYEDLWPGIDMVFSGESGTLKYAFHVSPGASPGDIRLAYRGVDGASVSAGGALLLQTQVGALVDTSPVSLQGGRTVPTAFALHAVTGGVARYGFTVGPSYDPARPLLLDPGIVYGMLLTGRDDEEPWAMAAGPDGSVYVTGYSSSSNFPATPGAFDESYNGFTDAFVTKLDPTGSTVLYSTFLGGGLGDSGGAIAVGPDGSAYVTGVTESDDFPTTPGALDRTPSAGTRNAFVVRLSPSGTEALYSTYLGGARDTLAHGIAVDGEGHAYVVGETWAADFPTTAGAYDTTFDATLVDSPDAFAIKLEADGSDLVFGTFLGAGNDDFASEIAVDPSGNVAVLGVTRSVGFPTTPGAYDTTPTFPPLGPPEDMFVLKLNPSASGLVYSTLFGGVGDDPSGLAVGADGGVYVSGGTTRPDFPTTTGADQTHGGEQDGFVTKLNPAGSALVYSTFVGGSESDYAYIGLDGTGTLYAAGGTRSTDFPVTADAAQPLPGGAEDAFVARLDAVGALDYATYLGDERREIVQRIAVDPVGVVYLGAAVLPPPGGARVSAAAAPAADFDVSVRTFVGACTVEGTPAAEVLTGTPGRDVVCGAGGADTIDAGRGNDIVFLGDEGATARGGQGGDALLGGAARDTLLGGDGRDLLDGGAGADSLAGGLGYDLLLGRLGNDLLRGESGNDRLLGGDGLDVLRGWTGVDLLRGGAGADRLFGDHGRDSLFGEGGNDRLVGGASQDLCRGGGGRNALLGCER